MLRFLLWLIDVWTKSPSDRLLITTRLLSTVGALPVHSIITVDDANVLHIQGKPVNKERALMLRESALNVLRSPAYQVIREQVLYQAVSKGVHEGMSVDQIQFSKAAIWFGDEEMKLLKVFASEAGNLPLSED